MRITNMVKIFVNVQLKTAWTWITYIQIDVFANNMHYYHIKINSHIVIMKEI